MFIALLSHGYLICFQENLSHRNKLVNIVIFRRIDGVDLGSLNQSIIMQGFEKKS